MTAFYTTVRDDGETEIVVEFSWSGGEAASYAYGGRGTEFDSPGCGPEIEVIACWLKADENRADAPLIVLPDAERWRIETEIAESDDAIPEADFGDDW